MAVAHSSFAASVGHGSISFHLSPRARATQKLGWYASWRVCGAGGAFVSDGAGARRQHGDNAAGALFCVRQRFAGGSTSGIIC